MKNFTVKKIGDNILLFDFKTRYELCMSFLRVQEFYESPYPEINGKYFTLEKYIDADTEHGKKPFDYFQKWVGFNIPGNVVNKWITKNKWYGFSKREKAIVLAINKEIGVYRNIKYYVIARFKNDSKVIAHETAHAYYYLDRKYRKEVQKIMSGFSKAFVKKQTRMLLKKGYCEKVIPDEIQAYCVWNHLGDDKENRKYNEKIYDVYMGKINKALSTAINGIMKG